MIKNKTILKVSISVAFATVVWAAITTVLYVRLEAKYNALNNELFGSQLEVAYYKQRAYSWQELAEKHNLKLQPPPYVK